MKITVTTERPEANKVIAKIVVAAEEVNKAIDKTYKDIAHRYNFQGFRRGRTPRPVIDGIIGKQAVMAQATNDLITFEVDTTYSTSKLSIDVMVDGRDLKVYHINNIYIYPNNLAIFVKFKWRKESVCLNDIISRL